MIVNSVNNLNNINFQSNKNSVLKRLVNGKNGVKSTDLRPIKNYSQYLKEYGRYIENKIKTE